MNRYRIYDNGKLLDGEYTSKEVETITGCQAKKVPTKASQHYRHQKRYLFEAVDGTDADGFLKQFQRRWNEARIAAYKKDGRDAAICAYCGRIIEGDHLMMPGYGTEPCRHYHFACFRDKRREDKMRGD